MDGVTERREGRSPRPELPSGSYGESPPGRGAVKFSYELPQNSEKPACSTPDSPFPIHFVLMAAQVGQHMLKIKVKSKRRKRIKFREILCCYVATFLCYFFVEIVNLALLVAVTSISTQKCGFLDRVA